VPGAAVRRRPWTDFRHRYFPVVSGGDGNRKGVDMSQPVVVRFAPSPTGYLHIGGARTAIFNWLFARKHGGRFILRIEDTDAERSDDQSIQGIVDGLRWLGLHWDAGPYFQSDFLDEHREAAVRLLAAGHAYRCFCSVDRLEQQRESARRAKTDWRYDGTCRHLSREQADARASRGEPFTLRLKVPRDDGSVVFDDVVYGRIEKRHRDLEDFIILRSNGQPLYVLSTAVDDIRDGISHVIRGQDGLANTPKQILIYRALGADLPIFAHMSLALDPKRAKISKRRHGEAVAVQFYRRQGFLPWALVNFLALYGWSRPGDEDHFSTDELIEAFSLQGLTRHNPIFDLKTEVGGVLIDPKAISMNAHYLRSQPLETLLPGVEAQLRDAGLWRDEYGGMRREWFRRTVDLQRTRFRLLTDFSRLGRAYFSDDYPVDAKAAQRHLSGGGVSAALLQAAGRLQALDEFEAGAIESALRAVLDDTGIRAGALMNAMRLALTGQAVGPDFVVMLQALGQETVVRRLERGRPDRPIRRLTVE
jgi:glutamyl-tRNA synthetase